MKRYTVQVRLRDPSLGPQRIKAEIERAFLYRRLPSIYRLGTITLTDSNTVQIEIASELERDELEQFLSSLETKLAVHVQRVGWGWTLTGNDNQVTGLANDPFASIEAQQDTSGTYTNSRRQLVRYIASIGLDVVLLLLVVAFFVSAPVRKVLNRQDRTLGLLKLRKDYDRYTIRSSHRSLKFPTGEVVPLKQESRLIKTILERASLFSVGDSGRGPVYKRFDAT